MSRKLLPIIRDLQQRWLNTWTSFLRRLAKVFGRPILRKPPILRPHFEVLEARLLPSSLVTLSLSVPSFAESGSAILYASVPTAVGSNFNIPLKFDGAAN